MYEISPVLSREGQTKYVVWNMLQKKTAIKRAVGSVD